MDTKLLVCEGACNPHLPFVDERLRTRSAVKPYSGVKYREHVKVRSELSVPVDFTPYGAIVSAVPVEHVPEFYACVTCGTVRQFGHDFIARPEAAGV